MAGFFVSRTCLFFLKQIFDFYLRQFDVIVNFFKSDSNNAIIAVLSPCFRYYSGCKSSIEYCCSGLPVA
ncbi:hypothetical protein BGI33_00210 [Snodgrassella alvi]|uniref:Uncharacterized protein n=1 Tax=Snodgrassella alvi TaxID=1196083 RepID=A0A2N9WRW2_9NEIS|nr:hypothetical protein BGI32_11745 [Snodgrassella alvi]PIT15782.1 hypothetical protein BGI34_11285 [Snodgrassella alvi]PIT18933.1 hypothetical protein BGI33_00210 [Snodgrassella alvi]